MRIFFHFILAYFIVCTCNAQNWQPINKNETFNYLKSPAQKIPTSIWVDSVAKEGTDSIYYLNRFVIPCEECTKPEPSYCYDHPASSTFLKNQGMFMQKKIIRTSEGVFRFFGKDTFAINPYVPINESWIFDTTNSITATTSKLSTEQILGKSDEIKTIVLSNGDTIELSKNHGITYFTKHATNEEWKLAGIEERKLGLSTPKAKDFFNFQVGDMFEYNIYISGYNPTTTIEKFEIISKTVTGDTTKYNIIGKRSITDNYIFHISYETINETLILIDNSEHILNTRNPKITFKDDCLLHYSNFKSSDNGAISLTTGVDGQVYQHIPNSDTILSHHYMPIGNVDTETYKTGLGLTYKVKSLGNSSGYNFRLVAYRKNNDTVGTFTDSKYLTPTSISVRNNNSNNLSIYPNPCFNKVKVDLDNTSPIHLSIIDLSGKIIKTEMFDTSSGEIDTSLIPPGLYILELTGDSINTSNLLRIEK